MGEIIQGSEEWHKARLGKVTASKVADIISRTKSGYAASRKAYKIDLVAERLSGNPVENPTSAAMEWGNLQEASARDAYAFLAGVEVTEVGFVDHPDIAQAGASPDGLVGADGLVEIKCPTTKTHIETLTSGKIPTKYQVQMLWQMECTGRTFCDFVSYDPRLPGHLQTFIKRFERDDDRLKEIRDEIVTFLDEVAADVETLNVKYAEAA